MTKIAEGAGLGAAIGGVGVAQSLVSDYRLSAVKLMPIRLHEARDYVWGAINIAAGLGSLLLFQITVNIGMVTGIMPVTGIPLTFITYGGSSMISLLFGMGLLQSVRVHSWKPTF